VLETLHADAVERGVERAREHVGQLHQRHAQVLRGVARQARAGAVRERRVGAGEVVEREPAAATEGQVAGIPEPPAEPEAQRQRQPTGGRDEGTRG